MQHIDKQIATAEASKVASTLAQQLRAKIAERGSTQVAVVRKCLGAQEGAMQAKLASASALLKDGRRLVRPGGDSVAKALSTRALASRSMSSNARGREFEMIGTHSLGIGMAIGALAMLGGCVAVPGTAYEGYGYTAPSPYYYGDPYLAPSLYVNGTYFGGYGGCCYRSPFWWHGHHPFAGSQPLFDHAHGPMSGLGIHAFAGPPSGRPGERGRGGGMGPEHSGPGGRR